MDRKSSSSDSFKSLIDTVQHNCHIADARHAGDYTLCVYLLKMREMYRWEQGLDFKTLLTTDDVGDWLTTREGVWDDVEEQEYKPLDVNDSSFEPFDNELINTLLEEHNLVYNAGLGIRCRPHFFVAELENASDYGEYKIYISGQEYARDMAAPAAMAQGKNIFIRRESLQRVIWEILDDAKVAGLDNPLTRAMSYYDFETDAETALKQMAEAEIEYVIQHEIGEVKAGILLDDQQWNKLLDATAKSHAEIMLRAVRDHLSDATTTLPKLIEDNNPASLHFYFGNMTAMRKKLSPSLMEAYQHWHETDQLDQLQKYISKSQTHWQKIALDALNQFSEAKNNKEAEQDLSQNIKNLIENNIL